MTQQHSGYLDREDTGGYSLHCTVKRMALVAASDAVLVILKMWLHNRMLYIEIIPVVMVDGQLNSLKASWGFTS